MNYQTISAFKIQNQINQILLRRLVKISNDDLTPMEDLIELLDMQIKEMDKDFDTYYQKLKNIIKSVSEH